MGKIKVLVFPCGAENAVEIHTALKDCVNIELWGASSKSDHGIYLFRNYVGDVPFIKSDIFLETFNALITANNIDVIIPTHDTVSLFLGEHLELLNAKVAVPGLYQADICRYKSKTYSLFADFDFCPVIYNRAKTPTEFPVFIKPDVGEGAKNTRIIESWEELKSARLDDGLLIVEYLPGEEITVDCFSDYNHVLQFAGARKRNRVLAGISTNSSTTPLTTEIKNIADIINEKLKLRGLWFFQLKKDISGKFKLLEISVRTAGTMNLYRNLGVNFPLLTVYDLMGLKTEILLNDNYLEVDRALFNRYKSDLTYDTVYIDFDDTITRQSKVNPFVMMFLYNLQNRGKKIILITRHEFTISETLENLNISIKLFDNIIHLQTESSKADYIDKNKRPIFIDNSFSDRRDVKHKLNIPVFDVDAIQSLIEWVE